MEHNIENTETTGYMHVEGDVPPTESEVVTTTATEDTSYATAFVPTGMVDVQPLTPPAPPAQMNLFESLYADLQSVQAKWKKKRHLTIDMFEKTLNIGLFFGQSIVSSMKEATAYEANLARNPQPTTEPVQTTANPQ